LTRSRIIVVVLMTSVSTHLLLVFDLLSPSLK
jgi:hypothetical protein